MRLMLKPFGLSSKVVFDDPDGLPTAPLQRLGCCSPHGRMVKVPPSRATARGTHGLGPGRTALGLGCSTLTVRPSARANVADFTACEYPGTAPFL